MVWAHFGYPGWMFVQLSGGVGEARETRKSGAGRRRRRPRGQKQVRNVSSDVPATFYGDWRRINEIFVKSPKRTISSVF